MIKILEENFNITDYENLIGSLISAVIQDVKPNMIGNLNLIAKDMSQSFQHTIEEIILFDDNKDYLVEKYKVKTYMELTNYYYDSKLPTNLRDREEFLSKLLEYIESNNEAVNFIPTYESLRELSAINNHIRNNEMYKAYIEEILFREFLDFNDTCRVVFNYDKYIKPIRAQIIKATNIEICPYCNENLIHNIEERSLADLDHFYLQSKLPLFGLTFMNFIPCCVTCNRSLKLQSIVKILNPRKEGYENKAVFFLKNPILKKDIQSVEVDLVIDKNCAGHELIQESNQLFEIVPRYNHNDTKSTLHYFHKLTKPLSEGGIECYRHILDDDDLTVQKVYEELIGFSIDNTDFINIRYGKLISDVFNKEYFGL